MKYYVVLDTNVIVSALLKNQSIPGLILKLTLTQKITPVINHDILYEYIEVLTREKFNFSKINVSKLINKLISKSIFIQGKEIEDYFKDENDKVFYKVILEAKDKNNDSYLVTGNLKHFPKKSFIVSPREMITILDKENFLEEYKNKNNYNSNIDWFNDDITNLFFDKNGN